MQLTRCTCISSFEHDESDMVLLIVDNLVRLGLFLCSNVVIIIIFCCSEFYKLQEQEGEQVFVVQSAITQG